MNSDGRATPPSLTTFVSHVAQVTDRSPNLREVVLEGGLDEFVTRGGSQFVYLMVPRCPGAAVPADHTLDAQLAADPDRGPIAAYYTIRAWDASTRRITLWMVRHGHRAGVGSWAGRCEIGERVALWGPRVGTTMHPRPSSYLLVADESGLGAVAALLDELPADASAQVFIETVDEGHLVELPVAHGVTLTWLYRHDDEPGTGRRLLDAVRGLGLTAERARDLVAFGAGESRQMARIRSYLRRGIGMPADAVSITGYWRR